MEKNTATKLILFGMVCLGLLAVTGVTQAQNPRIYQLNGDAALMNISDTYSLDSVWVSRSGTASNPEAFLSYGKTEIPNWCTWIDTGYWGVIPANALTGQGNSSMRLVVDTAQNPQILKQRCTQDLCYGGEPICEPPPDIVLDIQWKKLGTNEQQSTMRTKITTLSSVRQENIRQSMSSAVASGTIGDVQVRTFDASIGSVNSSTLEVEKRVH